MACPLVQILLVVLKRRVPRDSHHTPRNLKSLGPKHY